MKIEIEEQAYTFLGDLYRFCQVAAEGDSNDVELQALWDFANVAAAHLDLRRDG